MRVRYYVFPLILSVLSALLAQAAALSAPAHVDPGQQDAKVAAPMDKLFQCRDLVDAERRLECFDREMEQVEAAALEGDLVVVDREQMGETRRGLFGFNLPKINLFGRESGNGTSSNHDFEDVTEIDMPIADFSRSNGKVYFVLENGARWRQTDSTPVLGKIESGTVVNISKAALGSYKAKIGSKRSFRVERMN